MATCVGRKLLVFPYLLLLLLPSLAGVAAQDKGQCERFAASIMDMSEYEPSPPIKEGEFCALAARANALRCFCLTSVLDILVNPPGGNIGQVQTVLYLCGVRRRKMHLLNLQGCGPRSSRRAMFVFGDSYLDTGATASPPYGISVPGQSGERYSDGIILPDIAAKYLRLKGSPLPFVQLSANMSVPGYGINFASAGSGVSQLAVGNPSNNFSVQVSRFESLVSSRRIKKMAIARAIFLINAGGNDFRGAINKGLFANKSSNAGVKFQRYALRELREGVTRLRRVGATTFIFAGFSFPATCAPPFTEALNFTSCLPPQFLPFDDSTFFSGVRSFIKFINRRWKLRAIMLDLKQVWATIAKSPACYGYESILKPCCYGGPNIQCGKPGFSLCPAPSKRFWFDMLHPTTAAWEDVVALTFRGTGFTIPGPNVCDFLQVPCEGSLPTSCPSA